MRNLVECPDVSLPAVVRIACFFVGITLAAASVGTADPVGASGVFDADAPLEIQIRAPWRKMLRERISLPQHPAEIAVGSGDGSTVTLPVQIRLRGISRLERCAYPPLTLRFEATQVAGTPFEGQTVLHASIPCQPNRKYEEHTVQEYLAYRTYELLADVALRSRLVRLDFWNTAKRESIGTVDAFLVEDFDLAAERLGRSRIMDRSVARAALAGEAAALHSLFQFMIGHTDWAVLSGPPGRECCHNAVLLSASDGATRSGLVPLPFDFDGSGLVNTGDMRPNPALGIRDVRQRLFRGFCAHNEELSEALTIVGERRSDLQALFEDPSAPQPAGRARSWNYLASFYALLDDPRKVEREIFGHCRER